MGNGIPSAELVTSLNDVQGIPALYFWVVVGTMASAVGALWLMVRRSIKTTISELKDRIKYQRGLIDDAAKAQKETTDRRLAESKEQVVMIIRAIDQASASAVASEKAASGVSEALKSLDTDIRALQQSVIKGNRS